MPKIIIANALTDGLVVFLGADGQWVADIGDAVLADSDEELAGLTAQGEAAVNDCLVVDPQPIEVTVDGDKPVPVEIREQIRSDGPTISGYPNKHSQ